MTEIPGDINKDLQDSIGRCIQKFREGQPGWFEELWRSCESYIFRRLRFRVGGRFVLTRRAAENLTKDVWQELGNYLADYARGSSEDFWKWLDKVITKVKRRALRYYGARDYSLDRPLPPEEEKALQRAMMKRTTPTPLEILIRREERAETKKAGDLLDAVLNKLNPIEQYVIFVRFYDKLAYKQISQRLYGDESKEDYLKEYVLRAALRKMRRIYEKDYGIKEIPFK
ncbi:hypothetical protein ES703_113126 [subsurface metagenome]